MRCPHYATIRLSRTGFRHGALGLIFTESFCYENPEYAYLRFHLHGGMILAAAPFHEASMTKKTPER
jgi:hypothetical protein